MEAVNLGVIIVVNRKGFIPQNVKPADAMGQDYGKGHFYSSGKAYRLRVQAIRFTTMYEVGGALRFRFEAKTATSDLFTSNL
jgi:hypothetical protein